MKRMLIFILICLIVYACDSNKSRIELLEDYDAIYSPVMELDKVPKFDGEEKLADDIENIFKDNWKGFSELKQPLLFSYTYYVGENGKIEKMKRSRSGGKFGFHLPDNYTTDIEPKILKRLESVTFEGAEKDGSKAKFRSGLFFLLSRNKQDKIERMIYLGIDLNPQNVLRKFSMNEGSDFMVFVDNPPEPVGGMEAIQKNVVYPNDAKEKGIEGTVFVKAFIDENGKVVKTELIKGTNTSLDKAAAEAVTATKFIPGTQSGIPVKVQLAVPIVFKIQKK